MAQAKPALAKAVFVKVSSLTPGTHGHNLYLKVGDMKQVLEKKRPDGSTLVIHEALVGDSTGCILLTLRNEQVGLVKKGASIIVRNSRIEMFEKKNMRLAVDKWGLIEDSPQPVNENINWANNLSQMDYELVQAD